MQETNEACAQSINDFAENYMEKLFYYCLKRTGNQFDADDLTQDIALTVITALNKGTVPQSFPAWVWQIAHNRYVRWAKRKHSRNESETGADIGDYEIEDEDGNIADDMIHAEQTALLRRELAFIRSEYRHIIVAYYVEDKSVREIASALSLSVNTVKSRLLRARKILKEGMDMAREFGKRSYKPEDVTFCASGSQPSGLPWSVVQRSIPKNILLEASNNPSTLEELSVALGIALPYMEEEVGILYQATLLDKQGDKFVTNFFILDRDCRLAIYHALRRTAEERSRLLAEFMNDSMDEIRRSCVVGGPTDDNTLRWWLTPYLLDCLIDEVVSERGVYDPPVRANGESWGFVGYEAAELPESITMGHNGTGSKNEFWQYCYGDYAMWNQCGAPYYDEVQSVCRCFRRYLAGEPLTEYEKHLAQAHDERFTHLNADGYPVPDVLLFTDESIGRLHALFDRHRHHGTLLRNIADGYDALAEVFRKYSHQVLHDSLGYYIRMELYNVRMMAVHDLVGNGVLTLPDDPDKSSLGMHFILHG